MDIPELPEPPEEMKRLEERFWRAVRLAIRRQGKKEIPVKEIPHGESVPPPSGETRY
jgi:hypothetical protein